MSNLAVVDRPSLPAEELDLIKRSVANGATDAELKLFLFDCQRRGVHPLDKLLHFTKRGGKYTPVTSIDFMRSQAAMTGEMAGSDDPIFETTDDGKLLAARVTVYRITQGQRFPYSATARWSEYCPDNAPMWRKMPHTMLGKCAEALALRKAFPQQLAGLYTADEMAQADNAAPQAPPTRPTPSAHVEPRATPSEPNGGDSAAIDTTTGEVLPEGYANWLADLTATADEGLAKLEQSFKDSKQEYRERLTRQEPLTWAKLKTKARSVR